MPRSLALIALLIVVTVLGPTGLGERRREPVRLKLIVFNQLHDDIEASIAMDGEVVARQTFPDPHMQPAFVLAKDLLLSRGAHRVAVQCADGRQTESTITVRSEDTLEVWFNRYVPWAAYSVDIRATLPFGYW